MIDRVTRGIPRRAFLKIGVMALAGMTVPGPVRSSGFLKPPGEKTISFYNTHTAERLRVCYYSGGRYDHQALNAIDHILRDHRTGDIKPIDTNLIELLYAIAETTRVDAPFHVISGYRSPKTNRLLRKLGRGVAAKSLHMKGMAIDIRLPGYDTARLKQVAAGLKRGGVGYYPRSDFIHVDVGRVRYW